MEEGSLSRLFTETVLGELEGRYDVELFEDSFQGGRSHHYLSAFQRDEENPFDLFVYNIEDRESSGFSRFHAGLKPGVCIFHDILFTTRAPESLAHSPWEFTIERFKESSVPWPEKEIWPERNVPFGYREAALAFVAVFTSEWAHGEYRRSCVEYLAKLADGRRSYYLPFPIAVTDLHTPTSTATLRVAFAGSTRVEARAHKLLHALSLFTRDYELLWMLSSEELPHARKLCEEFGVKKVRFIQGRNADNWREVVREADIAFHLKFSLYGNDAPWLPITLMEEKIAVVSDFGGAHYLSDDLVLKVKPGEDEPKAIHAILDTFTPGLRHEGARRWCEEHHGAKNVSRELCVLLDHSVVALRELMKRWREVEGEARREVLDTLRARLSIQDEALSELGWAE